MVNKKEVIVMNERILIFDTTLRDGEQAPGFSMNVAEKLRVARQLERLRVDIIEAGFPIASEGDFNAVKRIAQELKTVTIAALARANETDIRCAAKALEKARFPRLHIFIATSDIHLEKKLKMSRRQVIDTVGKTIEFARKYIDDIEFSAEDATRSEWEFLKEVYSVAIKSGASTINIPDTVGYAVPEEFARLISYLKSNVENIENVVISVHCHNDLGMAVANSLAAIKSGARQVECTINGIGERAGNASLEEVAMNIKTRKDFYRIQCNVETKFLYPTSRLIRHITGIPVQPNKAIVGDNAFAHEAGIHQDGVLKDRRTYEIMTPKKVGFPTSIFVLGKHSGRHALKERLKVLGYELPTEEFEKTFVAFKNLADKKKIVYDEDLEAIVLDEVFNIPRKYRLHSVNISCGTNVVPTATVEMKIDNKLIKKSCSGNGPVDAVYRTIASITKIKTNLIKFSVQSLTPETDAMGEVTVYLKAHGMTVTGRGAHTDIVVASAKAYVDALNKIAFKKENKWRDDGHDHHRKDNCRT
ncbi:MAG: 2-isopropylmalate synthase [candidate division WOR-3 bacterium]